MLFWCDYYRVPSTSGSAELCSGGSTAHSTAYSTAQHAKAGATWNRQSSHGAIGESPEKLLAASGRASQGTQYKSKYKEPTAQAVLSAVVARATAAN